MRLFRAFFSHKTRILKDLRLKKVQRPRPNTFLATLTQPIPILVRLPCEKYAFMNLYVENAVSSYLVSEILFGVHFRVHFEVHFEVHFGVQPMPSGQLSNMKKRSERTQFPVLIRNQNPPENTSFGCGFFK